MILEIACAIILPALLIMAYIYYEHVSSLKKYPGGPFPMPLVGNLHQLSGYPYKDFKDLSKIYGPVFSISFGSQRVVVINNIEHAKEALLRKGSDFADRPKAYPYKLLSRDYKTISLSEYGPFYTTIKKLGHSALKEFGEGTKRIEQIAVEESEYFHRRLLKKEGKPMDISYDLGLSVLNIICELTFGKRYLEDDEEFKEIVDFTGLIFAGLASSDIVSIFPFLGHFPMKGISDLKQGLAIRDKLYRKKLLEHKATFDENNIRDIMDSVIKVLIDERTKDKTGVAVFTDEHVEMIVHDIFVGGSETIQTTLKWALVYLLHWPQYQDEVYDEIQRVCGNDRYPTYDDRSDMNLTYAVIMETMRLSSLAPLSFPRRTTCNTTVNGQSIPKDTQVIFNQWAINNDERHWECPCEFRPRRFLETDGKYIVGGKESFQIFGAGKRQCFGKAMAKMELFVLLARLLRDFIVEKVPGTPLPSLQGNLGLTLTPQPFEVILKSRNNNV